MGEGQGGGLEPQQRGHSPGDFAGFAVVGERTEIQPQSLTTEECSPLAVKGGGPERIVNNPVATGIVEQSHNGWVYPYFTDDRICSGFDQNHSMPETSLSSLPIFEIQADRFVKSPNLPFSVIPDKAAISQYPIYGDCQRLDPHTDPEKQRINCKSGEQSVTLESRNGKFIQKHQTSVTPSFLKIRFIPRRLLLVSITTTSLPLRLTREPGGIRSFFSPR